jgi:hypothetical protein
MNAAVASYIAQTVSADAPPTPPRPPARRRRRRRAPAILAAAVIAFTGSISGIAFATSGDDPSPAAPAASSGSDDVDPRPGRAGPGYVVD